MEVKNKKLWQKDNTSTPSAIVENYTVGIDYILDQELVPYDVQASAAHATMLASIGILTGEEKEKLLGGLNEILEQSKNGVFVIEKSDEDCHTAIENFLVQKFGDIGKKIHTGRSRNDQILVAMRLYMKDKLLDGMVKIKSLVEALEEKIKEVGKVEMPGYTHMQRAMPSSVGLWLGSFEQALQDDLVLLQSVLKIIDQNPLGSVVGYGDTTLGLDRAMTTEILGFSQTQENSLYCALSRGKFETLVLQAFYPVMFDLGKLSTDLMLFTTKEFGFSKLPDQFTTGSSAMPQKRNYDVCELMRASCSSYNGNISLIQNIIDKMPSGYNRDFQLTKEPFMKGIKLAVETIVVATSIVENLEINIEAVKKACTPELYATEEAYRLVKEQGVPFRDAYKIVAEKYLSKEKN